MFLKGPARIFVKIIKIIINHQFMRLKLKLSTNLSTGSVDKTLLEKY